MPDQPVTVIGGAGISQRDLMQCLKRSSKLISADGGTNYLIGKGIVPNLIIGDLDSLSNKVFWKDCGAKLVRITEQETTDFEKCIYSCNALYYLCLGFVGRRTDHFLSVCSTLVKFGNKGLIVIGSHDIILHIPKSIELVLPLGTRVSLFPMKCLIGVSSRGLKWPISGIKFDPSTFVGISNRTSKNVVNVEISDFGMLMILPRGCLNAVFNYLSERYCQTK